VSARQGGSPVAVERGAGSGEHAAEPNGDVAGLPFNILDRYYYSDGLGLLASLLLVTSVFIAMLSFHNTIGRYTFAMARERVLFAVFANVGHRFAGSPVRLHRRRCCRPGWRQPS
jgi:amino acid transporter